jgi:hypothetical protein
LQHASSLLFAKDTFQMSYADMSSKLAGPIGVLKQFVSRAGRETAEDSTQVFGGRALTTTGMGKIIENVRFRPLDSFLQLHSLTTVSVSVPSDIGLRCDIGGSRGCTRRLGRASSDEKVAKRRQIVKHVYVGGSLGPFSL